MQVFVSRDLVSLKKKKKPHSKQSVCVCLPETLIWEGHGRGSTVWDTSYQEASPTEVKEKPKSHLSSLHAPEGLDRVSSASVTCAVCSLAWLLSQA